MKRKFKTLITAFAVCAVSAFAVAASSCGGVPQWLEQARCEHKMDSGVVTTEATCTEKGEKTFTCVLCEYTETEEVDILPHTEIELKAVAPTCTKSGLGSGKKCAVCDEILVAQTVLAPTGHKVVTDEAIAPTCTEAGKTEGSYCGNCDLVFVKQETVAAIGHNPVDLEGWEATCEEDGYTGGSRCENCGEVYTGEVIPALGHSWGDGEITAEVTCTTDGVKVYTCSTCEETKEEVTEAPGHAWNDGEVTKAATCEEDGSKTFTCGTCELTKTQTIAATGHVYEDGTCIVCGDKAIELIEFTIAGVKYAAEEGMTWGEWCDSEYNTCNCDYTAYNNYHIYCKGQFVFDNNEDLVNIDQSIIAGVSYILGYADPPV